MFACFLVIGHQKIGDNAVQKTNFTPEPQWTFGMKISYLLSSLKVSFLGQILKQNLDLPNLTKKQQQ